MIEIHRVLRCWLAVFLLISLAEAVQPKYETGTVVQVSTLVIETDLLVGTPPQSCCKLQVRGAESAYSFFVKGSKQEFSQWLGLAGTIQFRIKNRDVALRFPNGRKLRGRLLGVGDLPNMARGDRMSPTVDPMLALRSEPASLGMPIDFEYLAGNNSCILLHAGLEADDFFKDFSRKTTGQSREFHNSSGAVEFFPDRMTIRVLISVARCLDQGIEASGETRRGFAFDERLLGSLQFEGYWKKRQSLETAPAELRRLTETEICPQSASSPNNCGWEYAVEVRSRRIPLTDALVISVCSSEGKLVSRFSVRL